MALDPQLSSAFEFNSRAERFYAALIPAASAGSDPNGEPGLGGKLLYAGELDRDARALAVASMIAGAASLAATADLSAQKQAIKDGAVDFVVTSLNEALRILKNEIRKKQPIAVCVAAPPESVEREMVERGVAPDLVVSGLHDDRRFPEGLGKRALRIALSSAVRDQGWLNWHVGGEPARWLPRLDSLALACLSPSDWAARRWLRLAPRYLGRPGRDVRVLSCTPETAKELMARTELAVKRGEIEVQVFVSFCCDGETVVSQPKPPTPAEASTEG